MSSDQQVFFNVLADVYVDDVHVLPGEHRGYLADRRSESGGELPVYILRAPASVSVEATGDASSDVAMPAMRDIDVTAAISEGKITVTEDRD